jgi:diadenosine hexaphosphate hydrolase (ATP-forming)
LQANLFAFQLAKPPAFERKPAEKGGFRRIRTAFGRRNPFCLDPKCEEAGVETMKEISAGGVVYRRTGEARTLAVPKPETDNGGPSVEIQLILDRYGKRTLAKGKMEPGETVEQTALREIREETGIEGKIVAPLETVSYQYEHPVHGTVDKEVHYFLVEAAGGSLNVQLEEIREADWFPPLEAWRLQKESGYDNNDSVLRKALGLLNIEVDG